MRKEGKIFQKERLSKLQDKKPTSKELNDEIEKSQVGTTYGNIVSSKLTNLLNIIAHATENFPF